MRFLPFHCLNFICVSESDRSLALAVCVANLGLKHFISPVGFSSLNCFLWRQHFQQSTNNSFYIYQIRVVSLSPPAHPNTPLHLSGFLFIVLFFFSVLCSSYITKQKPVALQYKLLHINVLKTRGSGSLAYG